MPPPPAELFASRIILGPALRAQPDGRLIGLVREGYDSAFEEIVRRYRRPLERFAAAIVGGRSEDVTQDAFSKALLALRGSEAEIELRPWLYRIVRNTALNDIRDRGPAPEQLSEALAGTASAAAEVERREELAELVKRLAALPEPQRAAIVMRELEGLSHEEIAAALGVSGGAARQAIYRARAALRSGFGLMLPLPLMRTLIEHADDAVRGGAVAAGATSAGGALGAGGALKLGAATLLVAGTVGAGIAVEHRHGDRPGAEPAEAAPLLSTGKDDSPTAPNASRDPQRTAAGGSGDGSGRPQGDGRTGGGGALGTGGSGVSGSSGDSSHGSTDDHGGRGGSGSGPGWVGGGHRDRESDSGDDNSGPGGGSGSDDGSGGGTVVARSGDDGGVSDSGDSSGSGSGEVDTQPEPEAETEPGMEDGGGSGGGSGSGEGSGDLTGTTNLDGSP
ncbi:MAG TPA: RNA polymerase sigma factor [Solirubrobacterales bacterium]|nr:RNA polymerase sigma factor [Solirubrobacterales bacterium]